MDYIIYKIKNKIATDYNGCVDLCELYKFCANYPQGTKFELDFSDVKWFDGNLCVLLLAIVYYLNKKFNHTFAINPQKFKHNFEILYKHNLINNEKLYVDQKVIPICALDKNGKDEFHKYLNDKLLHQNGKLTHLSEDLRAKINDDLLEIFANINLHANTELLFFVGGHYFPKEKYLKFTMVDLGDGFLPKINAFDSTVTTNLEAINWAIVEGNTSKNIDCPGGIGLNHIYKYCLEHDGILQIITGNCFWTSDPTALLTNNGGRDLPYDFIGTTINLFFRYDDS